MSARVVVVGGGVAGLTTAHRLLGAGVDVVVFEKASRYRLVLEKKGETWTLKRV